MYENLNQYELLKEFKNTTGTMKEQAFEEFFARFTPLLEKYAWKLGDKDLKFFLSRSFIQRTFKNTLQM